MRGGKRGVGCERVENRLQTMCHMWWWQCNEGYSNQIFVIWSFVGMCQYSGDLKTQQWHQKSFGDDQRTHAAMTPRSNPRIVLLSGRAYVCTSMIIVLGGVGALRRGCERGNEKIVEVVEFSKSSPSSSQKMVQSIL